MFCSPNHIKLFQVQGFIDKPHQSISKLILHVHLFFSFPLLYIKDLMHSMTHLESMKVSWYDANNRTLQGEHLVVEVIAEVFSVTKLSKIINQASAIVNGGFNGYVLQLKKMGGKRFLQRNFFCSFIINTHRCVYVKMHWHEHINNALVHINLIIGIDIPQKNVLQH